VGFAVLTAVTMVSTAFWGVMASRIVEVYVGNSHQTTRRHIRDYSTLQTVFSVIFSLFIRIHTTGRGFHAIHCLRPPSDFEERKPLQVINFHEARISEYVFNLF
jgi:hypothetical protein